MTLVRVVEHHYMPLVGAIQHRRHLLSRRDTWWLRLAHEGAAWQEIPRPLLRRLDRCTTPSQVEQLLTAVPRG